MADNKTKNITVNETLQEKKETEWKTKICPVVKYISQNGILGFMFDNIPCQMTVEKFLDIKGEISIKYRGDIKTGIEFRI